MGLWKRFTNDDELRNFGEESCCLHPGNVRADFRRLAVKAVSYLEDRGLVVAFTLRYLVICTLEFGADLPAVRDAGMACRGSNLNRSIWDIFVNNMIGLLKVNYDVAESIDIPFSFILARLVECHTMLLRPLLETFWTRRG